MAIFQFLLSFLAIILAELALLASTPAPDMLVDSRLLKALLVSLG